MKRLSRNRRIAALAASSAALAATAPVLLGVTAAHSSISDFARGAAIGFSIITAAGLLAVSVLFLKRDGAACTRS